MKHPHMQTAGLIFAALMAFWVPAHGPSFDTYRPVDIVGFMASGLCIGAALSRVLRRP